MTSILAQAWEELLRPMIFRPKRVQVAALCCRKTGSGTDVLMITSRGTGRWIIPKGWPIRGKNGAESALQEAWEEAGVVDARIEGAPFGSYGYRKERSNGTIEAVETLVYLAEVCRMKDDYPEAHQRKRVWMPAKKAANLVREPELQDLLRQL
ncbi:NUDIX hydrolase [Phaeobacter sp. QD34_3]|uniref:NUDIX hydrolase n=1 Tax=unclassified Phaeobacter TaxID=2621772 RepID=UPI00237F0F04|nr:MULTISPECIES: NUDIX hydrolase [unclassified Phaeobacter]MDE4133688.1 NUDIX hydrolase [Phaeobacter sp. QD34_3]MDE4137379.1 NUDIX hydrolase [Phaeobacter sp. QD34_24]